MPDYIIDCRIGVDNETITFCNQTPIGAPLLKIYSEHSYVIKVLNQNKIEGLIAIRFILNKWIVKVAIVEMSPLILSDCTDSNDNVKMILYRELKNFVKQKKVSFLYFSHWTRETSLNYIQQYGFKEKKYASFILNISGVESELFQDFDSKKRNMIRKGLKSNTIVKIFENEKAFDYINDFHSLMKQTQNRAIIANKNSSMQLKGENFIRNLLQKGNSYLALAFYEDVVIAGAVILYSGKTQYYYLGGSDLKMNRETAAADLLQWEIIKYGKIKNLFYYDFGGVPVNPVKDHPGYGVYKFKESFGGIYKEFYGAKYAGNIISNFFFNKVLENKSFLRLAQRFI